MNYDNSTVVHYVADFAKDISQALNSTKAFNSGGSFGWACEGPLGAVSNGDAFYGVSIGSSGLGSYNMAAFAGEVLDSLPNVPAKVKIDTCGDVRCNPTCLPTV